MFVGNRGTCGIFSQRDPGEEWGGFDKSEGSVTDLVQQENVRSSPAPEEQDDTAIKKEVISKGYVPIARDVNELYCEDVKCEREYADVADNDDDIVVENFQSEIIRIQTWEEADFLHPLCKNVKERAKYLRPRKIQASTIPFILDGYDVKCQAETGSGKTATYLLPIIDHLMRLKRGGELTSELKTPFALIVLPARELALQVFEQAEKFAAATGITVAKAYGQYTVWKNIEEIDRKCDILCATPGRLLHFLEEKEIRFNKLMYLVLDEVDTLLEENFTEDIKKLVQHKRFQKKGGYQVLLFSATFDQNIHMVADELVRRDDHVFISNTKKIPSKRVKQNFIVVNGREDAKEKLVAFLRTGMEILGSMEKFPRILIFDKTRKNCDDTARFLTEKGFNARAINSDHSQQDREEALTKFRNLELPILVSTDVCSRGIDIKDLGHIINLNMDCTLPTYIYRTGRAGRISPGRATSFVRQGAPILTDLVRCLRTNNQKIPRSLKEALIPDVQNYYGLDNDDASSVSESI